MSVNQRERKAKIVCTLGPASSSEAMLRELMLAGMDVARLNFSHGTHQEHARVIERVRKVAAREGRTICILQDLQGPKIRTGSLRNGRPVALKAGSRVTITPRDLPGTARLIPPHSRPWPRRSSRERASCWRTDSSSFAFASFTGRTSNVTW